MYILLLCVHVDVYYMYCDNLSLHSIDPPVYILSSNPYIHSFITSNFINKYIYIYIYIYNYAYRYE